MKKNQRFSVIVRLVLAITMMVSLLMYLQPSEVFAADGILKVHMLSHADGRNDSFIFELPNGDVMIIDNYDHNALLSKLQNLGITSVKYVVGTHQHNDHIGGLDNFLNSGFTVNNTKIYYPEGNIHTTNSEYTNLVSAANRRNLSIQKLVDGDYILNTTYNGKPLVIKCLGPIWWRVNGYDNDYTNVNDASLMLKITYGNSGIIMMGDAKGTTEADLLNYRDGELDGIQVMKIGHHGIRDAYVYPASDAFLDRLGVTKALITNGTHDIAIPIVENLQERNIQYWTTGQNGVKGPDVMISTDGSGNWTSDSTPYWKPGDTGITYYFIIHNASGMKLHPVSALGDVDLYNPDKGYYQLRWQLVDAGGGNYYIQNMYYGTRLYCKSDGSDVYMVSGSTTSNNVKWTIQNSAGQGSPWKNIDSVVSNRRLHAKAEEDWLVRTTSKVVFGKYRSEQCGT